MDFESNKKLIETAIRASKMSRRELLGGLGATAGAAALTTGLFTPSIVRAAGEKVRVGLGLNYGPFNQPWRDRKSVV